MISKEGKIQMSHIFHRKKQYMIAAVISILLCGIVIGKAYSQEGPVMPDLVICLGLSAVIALILLLMFPTKQKKIGYKVVQILINLITIIGTPVAAVLLVQNFTLDPFRIYPMMLAVNILFYVLIYLILACVFGSFRVGYVAADLIFLIIGMGNYFVVQFRGSPIVPWDLFSISTAASVAGNYTYEVYWRFAISAIGFLILIACDLKNSVKIHPILRVILGLLFAGGSIRGASAARSNALSPRICPFPFALKTEAPGTVTETVWAPASYAWVPLDALHSAKAFSSGSDSFSARPITAISSALPMIGMLSGIRSLFFSRYRIAPTRQAITFGETTVYSFLTHALTIAIISGRSASVSPMAGTAFSFSSS